MTNNNSDSRQRELGITVLADFILSEGIEPILDNLRRVGATAVACNPTVTCEAEEGLGSFQPPDDAGSSPRYFDRPLFGKKSLWVTSAPSYEPEAAHYTDSAYGPRRVQPLTQQHGHVISDFIQAAKDSGLKVYFQLGAVQPSGLKNEDRPSQPDGSVAPIRMADTGSLASPAIRNYNVAYIRDLYEHYPTIDGIRIDWPEYPCYTMGEFFHDFSPHVAAWCGDHDFDFKAVRRGVAQLHAFLSGEVTEGHLRATHQLSLADALAELADDANAIKSWLRLKAELSIDTIAAWRQAITATAGANSHLTAHAFMKPYSDLTGFDFGRAGEHCDSVSAKFYTMHWPLMVEFWSSWIASARPQVDRRELVRAVAHWMQLGTSDEVEERLERYYYPKPDEPHPIPAHIQTRKLAEVKAELSSGPASFVPLVHGYGPLGDFSERFRIIAQSDVDGVWINRYGYLSDDKLSFIAEAWRT